MTRTSSHEELAGARRRGHLAGYVTLLIVSLFCLGPFVFLLATSLSTLHTRTVSLRVLLHPSSNNYHTLFAQTGYGHWIRNSLIVAVSVTLLVLFVDSLAGYVFAKRRFRGREFVFFSLLATLMVPLPVTLLPSFLLMVHFNAINTYQALVLPGIATPLGVFLMRQFIESIPDEIDEAARLDGLSTFKIYWKIILPLSVPALAVLALFTFLFQWTALLWPLIVTQTDRSITIPPGLASLAGQFNTDYGVIAAGALVSIVPMLAVFVLLGRYLGSSAFGFRTQKG